MSDLAANNLRLESHDDLHTKRTIQRHLESRTEAAARYKRSKT